MLTATSDVKYFRLVSKNKWSTISRHPPFAQIYAKTSAKVQYLFEPPNF